MIFETMFYFTALVFGVQCMKLYRHWYNNHWVDTSDGRLLVSEDITRPVASASVLE